MFLIMLLDGSYEVQLRYPLLVTYCFAKRMSFTDSVLILFLSLVCIVFICTCILDIPRSPEAALSHPKTNQELYILLFLFLCLYS